MIKQEAIAEYKGTVITVSHNRYFIRQIVYRVVEVNDKNLQDYSGDYNVSSSFCYELLLGVHIVGWSLLAPVISKRKREKGVAFGERNISICLRTLWSRW